VKIQIRESKDTEGVNAVVQIEGVGEFPVTVTDPFSEAEEQRLEWYFEEHLRWPFLEGVRAAEAAASVKAYGEALFEQLFGGRDAHDAYKQGLRAGIDRLRFEIAGSPEFHRLHWEALKDPQLPRAFALEAPMVRKNRRPQTLAATVRPSPTINILVVTARPDGKKDVGYRTISRPLVEGMKNAAVPVRIDLVRPGTYEALVRHLERTRDEHGTGYYHLVHFDLHGALLDHPTLLKGKEGNRLVFQSRFGRGEIEAYTGQRAFLFFEGETPGRSDPVEAGELAELLKTHQVPIAVLNACQSGKQVEGQQETSLGSRLMEAGTQVVLAMAYSVTVSAAERLMDRLYQELFKGREPSTAIRSARLELANQKSRRAYFSQEIDLEDWLLPVVYENQPVFLQRRDFTTDERTAYYQKQADAYQPPTTTYGFVGRDLDVLEIEKRVLAGRNTLLVRGMGGAGKTTLLHHLGYWWQETGLVEQVFYFGYDERAWTREGIMNQIAERLLGKARYWGEFDPLNPEARQALLSRLLRSRRHLLVLDNLESVTGSPMSIPNTLPEPEQQRLRSFLVALAGGETLVLLGSRGGEAWLADGTFGENVYDLGGLDPEAASALADRILKRQDAEGHRRDPDLGRLMKLLDGFPLALEVVLANLKGQTPTEVLNALQAGDVSLDAGSPEERTRSILRCIEYSHGNLSPESQELLLCLAPFSGMLNTAILPQYTERLRAQPGLEQLPFDRWVEVLREAQDWGLVSAHPEMSGYLRLQPTFPYFLRNRLIHSQPERRAAVETAFREFYDEFSGFILSLVDSKETGDRTLGQALAGLEYENISTCLKSALQAKASIERPFRVINHYFARLRAHDEALATGNQVLKQLDAYPAATLTGELGAELVIVVGTIANLQLELQLFDEARSAYLRILNLLDKSGDLANELKSRYRATTYHQLGRVAQEQRQWPQAEQYYQRALEIKQEFQDRYDQASTYHQLGTVAEAQRQWPQAEQHYRQALEIKQEFQDRYSQANTYHQLGMVAQQQRQWPQAEQHYRQALEILHEFQDRYNQASTYHQLGRVAQQQRQWPQAEQYYRRALEIKQEFQDRYSQASTYHQLGIVAQEQRQWPQAEQYYRRALEIKQEFQDRYNQGRTYHQLGRLAQAQRQWAQARDYLMLALEISLEFQDQDGAAITLGSLATLWKSSGDSQIITRAAALLGESEEQVRELFEQLLKQADEATEEAG